MKLRSRARAAARVLPWVLLALLPAPPAARATWSIVAVDPETREVGLGAATCTVGVELIRALVPGQGVVAAQAATNFSSRDEAALAIAKGGTADDALRAAADGAGGLLGSAWADQQLAIAVLDPEPSAVAHTGRDTPPWSGARSGRGFSVQGNVLRGPEVVEAAFRAFQAEPSRSLAERILRALEAGEAAGGDRRCPAARPALTAFLAVARPDDPLAAPGLLLVAPRAFGVWGAIRHALVPYEFPPDAPSPVSELRRMFEERAEVQEPRRLAPTGLPPAP